MFGEVDQLSAERLRAVDRGMGRTVAVADLEPALPLAQPGALVALISLQEVDPTVVVELDEAQAGGGAHGQAVGGQPARVAVDSFPDGGCSGPGRRLGPRGADVIRVA